GPEQSLGVLVPACHRERRRRVPRTGGAQRAGQLGHGRQLALRVRVRRLGSAVPARRLPADADAGTTPVEGRLTMNVEERIAHHRRMALGYGEAYLHQGVQEGEEYEAWRFAEDAVYSSPYFTGSEVLKLNEVPTEAAEAATME